MDLFYFSVSIYDERVRALKGHPWRFFNVFAENENQILEYLDKYYPARKKAMFDRKGNPSDVAHDWTEITKIDLGGKMKIPIFFEDVK